MGEAAESAYLFDRNPAESRRLNKQQEFFIKLLNNELVHPSITTESLNAIADVATGTGLWLTSLPEYLRSVSNPSTAACILHGFDISPDQFPYSTKTIDPSNEVQFIVQDIRDPFPESYHGKYDLVNVSHLIAGLREEEYESAVRNLFDILKPNGHLQWTESSTTIVGTIQLPTLEINHIPDIIDLLRRSMSSLGYSLDPARTVEQVAVDTGFAHVSKYTYSTVERPDLRAQARDWLGTIWRTTIPPALLQVGRAGSMQEAGEMAEQWIRATEREHEVFWPTADLQVVVARKGVC